MTFSQSFLRRSDFVKETTKIEVAGSCDRWRIEFVLFRVVNNNILLLV
jgi:hypothetical protein